MSVDGLHELHDGILTNLLVASLQSAESRSHNDRGVLTIETVGGEDIAHLHVDELQHLGIIDSIDLVDKNNQLLDTDLLGKQQMLTGLGHLTVSGSNDNNGSVHLNGSNKVLEYCCLILSAILLVAKSQHLAFVLDPTKTHLGGTSDHVLNVISVSRAVDVSIMSVGGLVLDVGGRDGDSSGLLLGGLVDLVVILELSLTQRSQGLGNGSGQGGLSVIDVTDGSDVDVGLVTGELSIGGHGAAGNHAGNGQGSACNRGLDQGGLKSRQKMKSEDQVLQFRIERHMM